MKQRIQEQINRANAFMVHNHIQVKATGPDSAQAALDIGPESLNSYGMLHGGVYYTLADCACGCACREDGRKYVTLQGGLSFIKGVESGRVSAQASVRRRGRSASTVSVEITSGAGELLACGEFTFFCVGTLD